MALDAVIDKEKFDKLGDVLKPEYKEDDGMYFLDVTASEIKDKAGKQKRFALEDVRGLKDALQAEREEKGELAKANKAFEGLDAKEAKEAIAKLKSYGGKAPSDEEAEKARLGSMKKELEEKHKEATDKLRGEITTLESDNTKLLIDDRIGKALGGQKLIDGGSKILTPYIKSQISVVKDESTGERRAVVIDPSTGKAKMSMKPQSTDYMDVEEFVESMAKDKTYGAIFQAETDKSGTKGNKGETKQTGFKEDEYKPGDKKDGIHVRHRNPSAGLMDLRERQAESGD